MPLALAAERHPDLVERHLGTVVTARTRSPRATTRTGPTARSSTCRAARTSRPRSCSRACTRRPARALHRRALVIVLEEGAEAEVWEQYAVRRATTPTASSTASSSSSSARTPTCASSTPRTLSREDAGSSARSARSSRATASLDWVALGFGSAQRQGLPGDEARRPGRATARSPAPTRRAAASTSTSTRCRSTRRRTRRPTSPSAGSSSGRSSAVWRGMIKVDHGAQQTDAFQESRNLLLSKKAHADAIPGLEILANDVRCTHAAAIAQIDPEQLFYLRSHGLPEPQAPAARRSRASSPRSSSASRRGRCATPSRRRARAAPRARARFLSGSGASPTRRARAGTAPARPRRPPAARGSARGRRRRS